MKQRTIKTIALAAGVAAFAAAAPATAAELKMAFFASPKHHVWSKFMAPWGKALENAGVGIKVLGFPGSQIGGKPPGAVQARRQRHRACRVRDPGLYIDRVSQNHGRGNPDAVR